MAKVEGKILVTGATGYIGSHLVPRLLDDGCDVRVMGRRTAKLSGFEWSEKVEVIEAETNAVGFGVAAARTATGPAFRTAYCAFIHLMVRCEF